MIVYRITQRKRAGDIHGTGATLYPGRWNKRGTPILYTGESKEMALLETIVYIPPMLIPDLDILTLEIPDDSI
ncbi:MAG: RES family NAD+ phosphorylase [Lentimicrobium sp.]|jgi:RES domain-containing protein|nr:RES family NAD+ phosphorylase [Lentimicrobium sp.]